MAGVLTLIGEQKIAASIGGTAVQFTTIRIGDGNGSAITPVRTMTNLVRQVGTNYTVINSSRDPANPTHWRVTAEIPANQGPFNMREIAVFDAVGDMIAIAAHPTVEFLGPGGDMLSITTDIVFPISSTANISVTLASSALLPINRQARPFWLCVESAQTFAPPTSPAIGATYIIPANATGAWIGQAGNLAQWGDGGTWCIDEPPIGHVVCVLDQVPTSAHRFMRKETSAWVSAAASEAAYGFALKATAAEVAARTGSGFVTPSQVIRSGLIDQIFITSSQNITVPNGVTAAIIEMWGAGGGGGGTTSGVFAAMGGGGGEYRTGKIAVTAGTVMPVVIGSGGIAGSALTANWGAFGGSSSFAGIVANGGGGGQGTNSANAWGGAIGGNGGAGSLHSIPGQNGEGGQNFSGWSLALGGGGSFGSGHSHFAANSPQQVSDAAAAGNPVRVPNGGFPGQGGTGGLCGTAGGNGANGLLKITWIA